MFQRKPVQLNQIASLMFAGLLLSGTASAAFTISSVTNAASRLPAGLPSYGVAQGAVFSVTGTGVGQDPPTQATFPLPTSAGLNGVSMKVAVGSTTVDAIMVYVSANEVDAILPSNTPLGNGTVTVNNGGATASSPVTVVRSAFGIFTTSPYTGLGQALAFTTNGDGTTSLVSVLQPAQAGQTVTLAGTGLGAISGDETQSGAGGTPAANVTLWLGTQQIPVTSAGRGACCTGIDPTYPIPAGVAGWDLISFAVPDGVSGCTISVAVQTGNMVSNVATIAIAGSNGFCLDLSGINIDLTSLSGSIKYGLVTLIRNITQNYGPSGTLSVSSDVGNAVFEQIDVGPQVLTGSSFAALLLSSTGNCTTTLFRSDRTNPAPTPPVNPGTPPVLLDAGDPINVKGPNGAKPLPKGKDGSYSAIFAQITNIPLPGGLPPIAQGGPPYLDPGTYTFDNGGGGADIGPFTFDLNAPVPISWDNIEQTATIDRTQGVTVKWSGGDPNSVVGIGGVVNLIQGTVSISALFACTEKASAGQFTVPPFITLGMPAVPLTGAPPGNLGILSVSNILYQYVTIPGVDLSIYNWSSSLGRNVGFQ
jgi:uncharacterized protein (TIGR03437 family)